MLFKLAFRNMRRTLGDYAIYFVTLVLGVAIFYSFNSIGEQRLLFDLQSSTTAMIFDSTQVFIELFSVVVACVLGFLILYANRMLIGRRKHEFGIYLTLGMSGGEVSRVVLYETVLVGIVSLIVGLALGFFLSQLLSFFTAWMFGITLGDYHFVFSLDAFVMTLVCFAVIYLVVTLFNVITVNRFKLITLLSAEARNERVVNRNPWVCLLVFILALIVLALAYAALEKSHFMLTDDFWLATCLMLVGSLAFFWAVAGFVVAVLTRVRSAYLRGIAPFTVRQISTRMNTAFVSLWVVCVMLFFAITTFSIGMGLMAVLVGDIEAANPYDATLKSYPQLAYASSSEAAEPNEAESYQEIAGTCQALYPEAYALGEAYDWDMEAYFKANIPQWDEVVGACAQFDTWEVPGLTYGSLVEGVEVAFEAGEEIKESILGANISVVSLSQYNALLALQGKPAQTLPADEFLATNNASQVEPLVAALAEISPEISILGKGLRMASDLGDLQYEDNALLSGTLLLVVPDEVVEAIREAGSVPTSCVLNLNYRTPGASGDDALMRSLHEAFPVLAGESTWASDADETAYTWATNDWPLWNLITRQEMVDQASGFRLLISYLALYIGFVFLIATATILAIQQISQASDSEVRYRLLSKLGCDEKMLGRSLLAQVMIYFLAPLALALCHCLWAITVFNKYVMAGLGIGTSQPILLSVILVAVIYGGYMLVTFIVSRMVMRQAVRG